MVNGLDVFHSLTTLIHPLPTLHREGQQKPEDACGATIKKFEKKGSNSKCGKSPLYRLRTATPIGSFAMLSHHGITRNGAHDTGHIRSWVLG